MKIDIDINNCTDEEIDKYIEEMDFNELNEFKKKLEEKKKIYTNYEQSVKLVMNAIYGSTGNEYYYFYNKDVAESITIMGRNIILYTAKKINEYFKKHFKYDYKLLEKMNIKYVGEINKDVVRYIDTDSNFLSFKEVYDAIEFYDGKKIDYIDFIINLYNYRLKEYINNFLSEFANKYGVENLQNFELENIAYNVIWIAKKKYIYNVVFNNKRIEVFKNIVIKGFDIISSSASKFARNVINELLVYILKEGDGINYGLLIKKLKEYKEKMKFMPIDDISFNIKANNIKKYIISDGSSLIINKKAPAHIKGVGLYNYILNNSKYKNKYYLIKEGDIVKFYYIKKINKNIDGNINIFAYNAGAFPIEFAPQIDYDMHFYKSIIVPFNRILKSVNIKEISIDLNYIQLNLNL